MDWKEKVERLTTERLLLTRPIAADLADLMAVHTDPAVMATLGGLRTADELNAMHARLFAFWERDGFGWWIARSRADGSFVGRGGPRRVEVGGQPEVEIGYGIASACWGRGYATELARTAARVAFNTLGLPDVVSFTLPTNVRSRRVMEKTGLRYEADVEYAGLPHVLYRLRRADWAETPAVT